MRHNKSKHVVFIMMVAMMVIMVADGQDGHGQDGHGQDGHGIKAGNDYGNKQPWPWWWQRKVVSPSGLFAGFSLAQPI